MIKGYRIKSETLCLKSWWFGMNYHLHDKMGRGYLCDCSRGIRGMLIKSPLKGRKAYKLKRNEWNLKLGRIYK